MGKYSQFHPLLDAMLTKLADKENTTRDCWRERFDWVKAGCPVEKPREHKDDCACKACVGM